MALIHRVLVWVALIGCVVWSILIATPLAYLTPWNPKIGPPLQRWFGLGWLWCLGIRITMLHEERIPASGVVIAPNHESMFDILVMASQPKFFRWISKEEVGRIPLIGTAMRSLGAYFLTRNRSGGDMAVLKRVETGLADGFSVIIFPEGTRSLTGHLNPIKKGAFRTAQNGGVKILPVGLAGTFNIAPKGRLPVRWGHRVIVNYGEPLFIARDENLANAAERYRQALTLLIEEARSQL